MSNNLRYSGPGYIYVFRHPQYNNQIKVGLTKNPIQRQRQLYTTATPFPYRHIASGASTTWTSAKMRHKPRCTTIG